MQLGLQLPHLSGMSLAERLLPRLQASQGVLGSTCQTYKLLPAPCSLCT